MNQHGNCVGSIFAEVPDSPFNKHKLYRMYPEDKVSLFVLQAVLHKNRVICSISDEDPAAPFKMRMPFRLYREGKIAEFDLSNITPKTLGKICKLPGLKSIILKDFSSAHIKQLNKATALDQLMIAGPHLALNYNLLRLPSLTNLSISNPILSQIPEIHHLPNLVNLNISKTKIQHIENLTHFPNLKSLNLPQNQLRTIGGLNHVPLLNFLDLSQNNITKIEGLDNVPKLHNLSLFANQITKIEGFEHLPKLKQMNLDNNPLRRIENLHTLPWDPSIYISVIIRINFFDPMENGHLFNRCKYRAGELPYGNLNDNLIFYCRLAQLPFPTLLSMYDPTLYAPDNPPNGVPRSLSAIPSLGIYIHRRDVLESYFYAGNYHRRVLPYLNHILFVEQAIVFAKFLLNLITAVSSSPDTNPSSENSGSVLPPFPASFFEEFLAHAPFPFQQFIMDQLPAGDHPFRTAILEYLSRKDLPRSELFHF
ncbi:MAG: leucine-rich repeat domain-containing protein [Promethearchaeota archaeon]